MNCSKKKLLASFLLLFSLSSIFLFFLPAVSAISISPASIEIDFEPGYRGTFTFHVESSKDIETYTRGELTEYVTLGPIKKVAEDRFEFSATITLPQSIEKPGKHRLLIGAREVAKAKGTIAALTAVQVAVDVIVPYPGKYIEISLEAPDVKLNQPVPFVIHVSNLGTETITAKGTITVHDPADKILATLATEPVVVTLKTTERAELYATWDTRGQKEGVYTAKATVAYDGKEAKAETSFRIGALYIKILNWTKEVQQDFRNKFDIEVESAWNDRISGIYGEINVTKDGIQVSSFRTITFALEPWEKKTISSYWDTTGLALGEYDANITLYYEGLTSSVLGKVRIIPRVRIELPKGTVYIVAAVIFLIILINIIVWLLILRKRRREEAKAKRRK